MKKVISLRLFSFFIMAYMLLAFVWWAVLLFKKNNEVFAAQSKQLFYELKQSEADMSRQDFHNTGAFSQLREKHKRQQWMILGEVSVFSITLLIGLILIHLAYRKQMQLAVQQRNFLLSITHELKSPIASIKLVLETFLKRKLNEEQFQKLGNGALSETNRLNELVNDLLLSARLESTYRPEFETVDWNSFLKKIVGDFSLNHPEGKVDLILENELPATKADLQGLETIFINLLENALKYNFNEDKKIAVKAYTRQNQIWVEVADNGSGIPEKERKKVFNKFFRVGSEDTRKTKGTGLGLYIVKEIVKAHRGTISIQDNQPKGSIFKMSFPF